MIRDLFTTSQTVLDMWRTQYDNNGNEFSFPRARSAGYTAYMDPDSPIRRATTARSSPAPISGRRDVTGRCRPARRR